MKKITINEKNYPLLNGNFLNTLDFNDQSSISEHFKKQRFFPLMNIKENIKNYVINLAVPGFSKEDIKIKIEDNILTVYSINLIEETDEKVVSNEFINNKFQRRIELPNIIEKTRKIITKCEKGILKITFYKKKNLKK